MKNIRIRRIVTLALACLTILPVLLCSSCFGKTKSIEEFYNIVCQSQECLDEVADDIYSYWYDAIYEDEYYGNITLAVSSAKADNKENLATIEANDIVIHDLYKEIRDTDLSLEIKAVMSAYSDYYELVVNVSGSYNSYSESKEKLKKELASTLKDLSMEL